jgi:hypothetical protein
MYVYMHYRHHSHNVPPPATCHLPPPPAAPRASSPAHPPQPQPPAGHLGAAGSSAPQGSSATGGRGPEPAARLAPRPPAAPRSSWQWWRSSGGGAAVVGGLSVCQISVKLGACGVTCAMSAGCMASAQSGSRSVAQGGGTAGAWCWGRVASSIGRHHCGAMMASMPVWLCQSQHGLAVVLL